MTGNHSINQSVNQSTDHFVNLGNQSIIQYQLPSQIFFQDKKRKKKKDRMHMF